MPCKELLITDEVKAKALELSSKFENELLGKIAEGMKPEGMESLIPMLIDDLNLISQLMPKGYETIFIERERVIGRVSDLLATNEEFREAAWANAAVGAKAPIEAGSTYIDWDSLVNEFPIQRDFRQFGTDADSFLNLAPIEPLRGNSDRLINLVS